MANPETRKAALESGHSKLSALLKSLEPPNLNRPAKGAQGPNFPDRLWALQRTGRISPTDRELLEEANRIRRIVVHPEDHPEKYKDVIATGADKIALDKMRDFCERAFPNDPDAGPPRTSATIDPSMQDNAPTGHDREKATVSRTSTHADDTPEPPDAQQPPRPRLVTASERAPVLGFFKSQNEASTGDAVNKGPADDPPPKRAMVGLDTPLIPHFVQAPLPPLPPGGTYIRVPIEVEPITIRELRRREAVAFWQAVGLALALLLLLWACSVYFGGSIWWVVSGSATMMAVVLSYLLRGYFVKNLSYLKELWSAHPTLVLFALALAGGAIVAGFYIAAKPAPTPAMSVSAVASPPVAMPKFPKCSDEIARCRALAKKLSEDPSPCDRIDEQCIK